MKTVFISLAVYCLATGLVLTAPSPDHHHHKSDGHNHTADTHVHTGHHHGDGHSHEHHTPSDGHKHAAGTHVHSDETHTKCHSPMSPTVACNKTEFFFDQASDSCKQRPANQCGSATSMNKFDSLATCMSLCKEKIMDAPAASGIPPASILKGTPAAAPAVVSAPVAKEVTPTGSAPVPKAMVPAQAAPMAPAATPAATTVTPTTPKATPAAPAATTAKSS